MTTFSPLRYVDGYLPIEDHGLIGDGTTAALVGRDGAITWVCVPRFDSPPLFCGILDVTQGGYFKVAPDGVLESRQFYEPDTGVLVTELRSSSALVRITDALTLRFRRSLVTSSEKSIAGQEIWIFIARLVGSSASSTCSCNCPLCLNHGRSSTLIRSRASSVFSGGYMRTMNGEDSLFDNFLGCKRDKLKGVGSL